MDDILDSDKMEKLVPFGTDLSSLVPRYACVYFWKRSKVPFLLSVLQVF